MRFKRVYIEITNTCNLSCSFCIKNDRVPKQMNVEEFQKVIEQVKEYTNYVYFHILGEPLSHPHLATFLTICEQANLQVTITTNGTLLKKMVDTLCHKAIRQMNISVHSFPTHQQKNYLQDIMESANKLASHNIHVNYRLWNIQNDQLSKECFTLMEDILAYYKCEIPSEIVRLKRLDLQPYIHLHFEEVFTWPSLANPYVGNQGRCLGMKQMLGILSDGRVVPCCLDSKAQCCLGNIFETPLSEIVNSDRVKRMQQGFEHHKVVETLCQHCSYRLRFSK